jgi:hypothetical protein
MKAIQVFAALFAVVGLVVVMQFPDRADRSAVAAYQAMPAADLEQSAEAEWAAGRRGEALHVLEYVIQSGLPEMIRATGRRDGYLRMLSEENTLSSRRILFGQSKEIQAAGSFDSLAGASVADLMQRDDVADLRKDPPAEAGGFVAALDASRAVTGIFPPSELAFTLLRMSSSDHALTPELETQLGDVLKFVRSAADTPAALTAVQESIMPVYQLARKCRTVAEFEALMRHCRSIEQIKTMTRIAGFGPANARILTQVLTIAGSGSDSPAPLLIEHVLRYGQAGLDTAWHVGRKGPAGLTFAVRHPAVTVDALVKGSGNGTLLPNELMRGWTTFRERSVTGALLSKYTMLALFCLLLLTTLVPTSCGAATTGEAGAAQLSHRYWGLVVGVSLALSAVIFVGSMSTHRPSEADVRLNLSTQNPGTSSPEAMDSSAISTGVIMACVVAMQALCWLLAHQRVRRIESDLNSSPLVRFKRLENMDIFFDLPLYFGLGGTILSFILITTFGIGMARFLAYSSTLVGIIVSVVLRLAYLYPLREKLTMEGRG